MTSLSKITEIGQNWSVKIAGNTFVVPFEANALPEFCNLGYSYFYDNFNVINPENYGLVNLEDCYIQNGWLKLEHSPSSAILGWIPGNINMPIIQDDSKFTHIETEIKIRPNELVVTDSDSSSILSIIIKDTLNHSINIDVNLVTLPNTISGTPAKFRLVTTATGEITIESTPYYFEETLIEKLALRLYADKISIGHQEDVTKNVIFSTDFLFSTILSSWSTLDSIEQIKFQFYRNETDPGTSGQGATMEIKNVYVIGSNNLPNNCLGLNE